jgi:hypothetical protein
MTRLVWMLPAAALLSACNCIPNITTTDGGVFDITPAGTNGVLIDTATGVSINVPKGAVDSETDIFITVIDTGIPDVPGRKRISYGYRLSPSMLQLNSPVTLYLPYLDDRVPMGVDPGTFDMRRQDSMNPYLALPGSQTQTMLKVVQADTDHLGLFWLTSPAQADVAMLTLNPTEVFLKVGDNQQFTATVQDSTGATVDAALKWKTLPPRVGTITDGNDGGFFHAADPGIATVTVTAGLQTATATVHVKGSAVGPNTYVHENPFPTGNDLWGGEVLPGTFGSLFVGANGTVLSRDMAGAWTRLYSSPGLVLKAVGATNTTNAAAVGTLGTNGVLIEMQGAMAPKVTTFTTVSPQFMWYDGTTGMAVGTGNDVLVKRNGAWTKEYNPSFEPLLSVIGDGMGGFVVLGGQGSLYKYDPMTMVWNSLYQTQLAVLLTAGSLVASDGSEAWACGGNKLWHFQSNAWTSINLPAQPVLTEATALGLVDGKIVIGGVDNKTGWAEVFDPSMMNNPDAGMLADGGVEPAGWTVIPMRGPQVPRGFFSGGPASTVGYLVGDYGMVWSYQGGTLVEESHGFYGDVVSVAALTDDVIAAVNECSDPPFCTTFSSAVWHRTGQGQFELLGGTQPFSGAATSVVAHSATDVVVSTESGVFFFDGMSWNLSQTSATSPITALKYCGTTLFGVDATGTWYRGTAGVLTRQPPITSSGLYALHCPTDMETWTAGDGVLFSRDGTGGFTEHTSTSVNEASWRAVWSPGQGEAWAFGLASYGIYWDTEDMIVIDGPGGVQPTAINGMWGSTVDNLYAVGVVSLPFSFGMGVRFDGSEWTLVDTGSQREVLAIDGAAPLNVWIGSRGGGILRGVGP